MNTHVLHHPALGVQARDIITIAEAHGWGHTNLDGVRTIDPQSPWLQAGHLLALIPIRLHQQIARHRPEWIGVDQYTLSACMGMFPDHVWNQDGGFLPLCMAPKAPWITQSPMVFLRPDAGTKSFPGQVIPNTPMGWHTFLHTYTLDPQQLVYIGPARDPGSELRTWITPDGVIAHAGYTHDDRPGIRAGQYHDAVAPFAKMAGERIAAHRGYATMTVLDLAIDDPTHIRIVEWNHPQCSGTYGANIEDILMHARTMS